MPQTPTGSESVLEKGSGSMLEAIILLAFCGLVGLASLAVVVWLAVSGSLLSLDGLAFALISLTLGAFFMFNIAWSWRTGELRALLGQLRKKKATTPSEGAPAGESGAKRA
jgi:hypothetical protein